MEFYHFPLWQLFGFPGDRRNDAPPVNQIYEGRNDHKVRVIPIREEYLYSHIRLGQLSQR